MFERNRVLGDGAGGLLVHLAGEVDPESEAVAAEALALEMFAPKLDPDATTDGEESIAAREVVGEGTSHAPARRRRAGRDRSDRLAIDVRAAR